MRSALVFPGQGSQRVGMAHDFYEQYASVRDLFAKASDTIALELERLCFTENDELDLTSCTQPALLTVEYAIYIVAQVEYDLRADFFAGHSLGEYSALVAAGAIDFFDALQIVRQRGLLMQNAHCNGAMLALLGANVLQTLQQHKSILTQAQVEIANLNSKDQVVISGRETDVLAIESQLRAQINSNIDFVRLNVQTPFHSSYMRPILAEFQDYLQGFAAKFKPQFSQQVFSNYTGQAHVAKDLVQNLTQQIAAPVQWIANMQGIAQNCRRVYEIGPNRVLSRFFATLDLSTERAITTQAIINLRSLTKLEAGFKT